MSKKEDNTPKNDWEFISDAGEEKEESKVKQFLMILIPVGALVVIGVVALIISLGVITKINKKNQEKQNLAGGDVNVETLDVEKNGDEDTETVNETSDYVAAFGSSDLDTGNLSQKGSGYEGIKGTGDYNYGEALQKSLLFYELQRSGDLPTKVRCNWRGDSCLNDGSDNGLDLSGGWYDAGDNVKFNLPMSYTAAMLAWSIYEDKKAYEESGQVEYAMANIKWANDYFIKCHPEDEVYYYQVGDGNQDHSWWGAAEVVDVRMSRPSYCVTRQNPGSAVCAETAASLAACAVVYKDTDKEYSELCLKHAKSLYKFARDTKSDAGYTAANGFYNSWSGYNDELAWSGAWLYIATGDNTYLENAKADYNNADQNHKWAMCWDDVHIGAAVLLAKETNDKKYADAVEKHLDWWTTGVNGEKITYTPKGLAWLDSWGSLRYATTTAYIASIYADSSVCNSSKKSTYEQFALSQAGYALGSTGRSFEIGFGENSPKNPHHRTAQGSYCDNMNEPSEARHILYGALVGGPDANDGYTDTVTDYTVNEVACDYNAGFTGLLAHLYSKYHGQTIKDFGAVEEPGNELYVEAAVNVSGSDFVEIKALTYNTTGWPARVIDNLELRYFVDLSEVYSAGGSASDIEVTTNYMQAGTCEGLKAWDEANHIYYVSLLFDKTLYPGGQSNYKQEVQFRIKNNKGTWDDSNDPSFSGLQTGTAALAQNIALYDGDKLVFGTAPAGDGKAGESVKPNTSNNKPNSSNNNNNNNNNSNQNNNSNSSASGSKDNSNDKVALKVSYTGDGKSSISGTIEITNNSSTELDLSKVNIIYYFTKNTNGNYSFDNYHSAVNTASGEYKQLSGVTGSFDSASGTDCDQKCTISISDSVKLKKGDTFSVNFAIHPSDWSNISTGDDYSYKNSDGIVVKSNGSVIIGKEP